MTTPIAEDVRQIIVLRKDLPMTAGKLVAQGAHASMKVLLDRAQTRKGPGTPWTLVEGRLHIPERRDLILPLEGDLRVWLEGKFTKICVRVESEAELLAVYGAAITAGLPCAMIEDAGLTAFKGVPTKTCCAIGPASRSALEPITGGLRLL